MLEQKPAIDTTLLEQISKVLKVPVEAFRNFDEEKVANTISGTFHDESVAYVNNYNFNINPLEEIKRLHEKKVVLYDRMPNGKDKMMTRMEQLIKAK